MPVDQYNERFLQNGPVPQTGSKGQAAPPQPGGRAVGYPPIQQSDGMANLRSNQQTLTKSPNASPAGSRSKPTFPGGHDGGDVTQYPDGV